ncbi:hypothetical protein QNR96_002310 [Staphylococcus pseudintermedius]|nr:hypothetical protein [Staphylococcus pseudintermedius]
MNAKPLPFIRWWFNLYKLDIVLNAKDLIGDIQERARERRKKALEKLIKIIQITITMVLVQLNRNHQKQRVTKWINQSSQNSQKLTNTTHQFTRT